MKKWFYNIMSLILSLGVLTIGILYCASRSVEPDNGEIEESIDENTSSLPSLLDSSTEGLSVDTNEEPMKGVWVPFMCLDMTDTDRSEASWRSRMKEVCDNIRSIGGNTVILHVRPFGDALYDSDFYPSSHLISGEQGAAPDFDPLMIALEEAKRCDLRLHAWVNPFRVQTLQTPQRLADNNPAVRWQHSEDPKERRNVLTTSNGLILNPASEEVRKLIINGVREIAARYPVDGIQIDDYFYPENDEECDRQDYKAYCKKAGALPLSHQQWRKENVNSLISGMYEAIHQAREGCLFGIAPQCNLDNNEKMGADVQAWSTQKGYADYICPQIYVSEAHPFLPFAEAVQEWRDLIKNPDAAFYVGIALYKLGTDADDGTWLLKDDNIASEWKTAQEGGADGVMLYSYEYLQSPYALPELRKAFPQG